MKNQDTTQDALKPDAQKTEGERLLRSQGVKLPFDTNVLSHRMRISLRTDEYEAKEASLALKLIKQGDVVLELGAGIGFISSLIATQTEAATIHCYEANPALVPFINRVHALNGVGNAKVHNAVLGTEESEAVFYVRRNFLSSSLAPMDEDSEDTTTQVTVPVVDGNQVLKTLRPSVLVCDIEGAESTLLPQLDLSGLRAVMIELHPQFVGQPGIKAVFDTMAKAGLTYFPRWSHAKVVCFRNDW